MEKRIVISVFFLMIFLIGLVAARAPPVVDDPGDGPAVNDTNSTAPENYTNKSINWSIRCNAVNNRINGLINQYDQNHYRHINNFNRMLSLFQNALNAADSRGFDVSNLSGDLIILNESVAKFRKDHAIFIQKLKNTRNFTCGHSEGQFQAALNESKAQLRIVRDDVEVIKQFYQTTVKEDIKSLREQRIEAMKERVNKTLENLNKTRARLDELNKSIHDFKNRTRENFNKTLGDFRNRVRSALGGRP